MAQIFLSYAREDQRRAQSVARALEKAGHSVWWDRHLAGGSEYSNEIATALDQADVVVVLWSKAAAASPWVRDEAAKGRDRGRLVPASLDGTDPPLGFGQFHTIYLKRGSSSALRDLCDAVGRKSSDPAAPLRKPSQSSIGERLRERPLIAAAAALLIVAAALGAWLYSSRIVTSDKHPVLAVMPFADMSPSRNQAALGEGVAEEIMTLVSGMPGVRVIGRSSAWQLAKREMPEVRSKLGATHLLEGSVRSVGDQFSIAARLISTDSGEEVWSEEFRGPLTEIFETQEAISTSVAQRLRGTFSALREARKARAIRTSPEVYKLYLNARAIGRRRDYESQLQAQQLLERALALDANYAPAHAFLAITLRVIDNLRPSGPDQQGSEIEAGLRHARAAIRLAPDYAEGYVGLGMVLSASQPPAALAALEKGAQLDPGNFYAWNMSGNILGDRCRLRKAADHYRRAVEVEPLLPLAYQNLSDLLADMGRDAEAEQLAARFSATGVEPHGAAAMRGSTYYWSGKLTDSYRAYQIAGTGPMNPFDRLYVAYLLNLLGRSEEAEAALPEQHRSIVSAYWQGNYPIVASQAATLGPDIWNMFKMPQTVGKAMVHAGKSEQFVSLFYRRWTNLDGFVREQPCQLYLLGPTLVAALRDVGRNDEAARVLNATAAEYRYRVQNGLGGDSMRVEHAAILSLLGQRDLALSKLEAAVGGGWLNEGEPFWVGLHDPAFKPIASDPRFQALQRRIDATLARQAAQVQSLPRLTVQSAN